MKKQILKGLVLLGCCLLALSACSQKDNTPVHYLDDLKMVDVDMSGYQGFNVAEHQFKRVTLKEANRIYKEGGSGILYYGYTSCTWCTQAVPVMNEVAKELGLTIYYVDMGTDDGNTEESYNEFIDLVKDFLKTDDDGEPALFVPQVFVVKNGKIVGDHLSTVDSYSPSQGNMTDSQKKELKGIYKKIFEKLK